jgi:GNAT superfamily N-acetyltransferase
LEFGVSNAGHEDIELLVAHRQNMWHEIYPELGARVDESTEAVREWIRKRLSDGTLVGFIVRAGDGAVAGSGCLWIRPEQPRPTSPHLEVPYLMSMYTEKAFRRKGVGKRVVEAALQWSREHGYERVVLHASIEGRPLYEAFGFAATNEMRLEL